MNKLKKKIFYLTFTILTLSLLGFIIIFSSLNYLEQKRQIENSLNIALNDHNHDEEKPDIKFMDKVIYTILLNENNDIIDVINYSNNSLNKSEIETLGQDILNSDKLNYHHIGFLYFEKYSYQYERGKYLTIIDNSTIQNRLLKALIMSISLFVLLEFIIVIISKIITNSIIKPVVESFDAQKRFIADASHELKTPLSVIIASSEALEINPKEKKWFNNIKNEANRMNILVSSLLDLSVSEKESTYRLEENNLSKTIELELLRFEVIAFENDIKLDYELENDIIFKYDENAIKELVEILIDNALKHADKKSKIDVQLKKNNGNIIFTVSDVGDVIPPSDEEKIFERFYRVDKSRSRKENRYGLGLSIAKNIVLNHNGTISAKTTNKITTFKVLFKK